MFSYYNNESLRKLVVGFGNLFNDMYIGKYDKENNLIEKDRVPLTYGPKEKFIRRIKEVSTISDTTRTRITLPRMGFEMLGMSYDPTRKANKLRKTSGSTDSDGNAGYNYAEVPYLVNFGLYTFTRNIEENLQLVEQILPIFAPEFIISMNFTDINKKVNVPIILTSTGISEIYEGDFSETRSITTTFSFIAKTYIYGNQKNTPMIETSNLNFFTGTQLSPDADRPGSIEKPDDRDPVNDNAIDTSLNPIFGPYAIDGYYPLYTTPQSAVAASPDPTAIREGETTVGYHTHAFGGVKYYMPNGLVMEKTQFHGTYPDLVPGSNIIPDPTDVDPNPSVPSIVVAGGGTDFPWIPSLIENGSPYSMNFFSQGAFNITSDREAYKNQTDEEFRQIVIDYLAGSASFNAPSQTVDDWIEDFGEDPTVVRSTYLNENTTGWILLDWEKPLNLGAAAIHSQEDLTWWTQGVIRRINILREFLPNAKFGLWRFGQGRNARFDDDSVKTQLDNQVFASSVEYKGKTLFDSLDFLSPTMYHNYEEGSDADIRVRNGTRAQRNIEVCDAIFERHGEVKPVVPIIAHQYEGGPLSNQNAYELNALEINYLRNYADHWAYWFASTFELENYPNIRNRLVRYFDNNYPEYLGPGSAPGSIILDR